MYDLPREIFFHSLIILETLFIFVAACPLFDADLIFFTDGNCDVTCPVNAVVIYLCEASISGQATCTESSTWDQTCTHEGE